MRKIVIFIFLINTSSIFSQWVSIDSNYYFLKYKEIVMKNGEVTSCSWVLSSNSEFSCYYYINTKQPFLIYFECKNSLKNTIKTGYLKVIYSDTRKESLFNEGDFCIRKELIWHYFDENGKIKKTEFYDNGILSSP